MITCDTPNTEGPWLCVDDTWDPYGSIPYADVPEFLGACNNTLMEHPELYYDAGTETWLDANLDTVVLRRC